MKVTLGELCGFVKHQLHASMFALFIIACLFLTRFLNLGLDRYDAMLVLSLGFQSVMVLTKLETPKELLAITIFHVLGTAMEIYKVKHGSWQYPDEGFKLSGVPLFSGFMYASVASYLMQSWRLHKMTVERFPSWWLAALIGVAIYANFYFSRVLGDFRWLLASLVLLCFGRTFVHIDCGPRRWRINLLFGFLGLGFWVWVGENVATYLGAWLYPNQMNGWKMVEIGKLSSWCMLVVLTFLIVAFYKLREGKLQGSFNALATPTLR